MSDTNIEKSEKTEYIFERRPKKLDADSAADKFDVVVPTKNLILIIGIFAVLFLAQFFYFTGMYYAALFPEEPWNAGEFYWWTPIVFLGIAVVIVLAWANIGSRFAYRSITAYLKKTTKKGRIKPSEFVLGYPMRTKDIYYLEAFPDDLNLGSEISDIKILIKRVMEVLFLSLGMSTMIAQLVTPYIYSPVAAADPDLYFNMEEMIIDVMLYLGPFTLIILMFVMPVFWIAEDVQAYRVTPTQDSVRVGLFLRGGLLSKILSFFGIILVYNLAEEFASALVGAEAGGGTSAIISNPGAAISIYTTTFIWFGLIIAMSAAIPFLVTFVYLGYFHERWVNNVRIKASDFMPIGTMEVRKPRKARMEYMNMPDKIDESGGFFRTKQGRIILLALIIGVTVLCIWLAFILGYEFALFP